MVGGVAEAVIAGAAVTVTGTAVLGLWQETWGGLKVYIVPTGGWPLLLLFAVPLLLVLFETVTDWKLAAPAVKPTDAEFELAAIVP